MFEKANGFEADVNLIDDGKSQKLFTMKKNLLMINMQASSSKPPSFAEVPALEPLGSQLHGTETESSTMSTHFHLYS